MARVAGEVEELSAVAEADLDLVDRAAATFEQVLDPAALQPGAHAGQGPVDRGDPAHDGLPGCRAREAAGHEVEDLVLVDRTDRR